MSTSRPKLELKSHGGSSGVLIMLLSIVLRWKLFGQKVCDEVDEEKEHEFLGVFDVFLK